MRIFRTIAIIICLVISIPCFAGPPAPPLSPEATQAEAEGGTVTALRLWSPLRIKQAIDELASAAATPHDQSGQTDWSFGNLGPANVYLLHKDGTQTAYPASADTNAARGTALLAAQTAAAATDTIIIGPGTYDTDATPFAPPCSAIGSGPSTIITNSVSISSGGAGAMVVPPDGGRISNLKIQYKLTPTGTPGFTNFQAPVGCGNGQTCFTTSSMNDVDVVGETDGVYLYGGSSTLKLFNCTVKGKYDAVRVGVGASSDVIELYNTPVTVSETSAVADTYTGIRVTGGTVRTFGGSVTVSGSASVNRGIHAANGGAVETHGTKISATGTGAVDLVQDTTGVLTVDGGTAYSSSSGTITAAGPGHFSVMSLGLGSTTLGTEYFYNNTNNNPYTIFPGATGVAVGHRWPTAMPASNDSLVASDTNGYWSYLASGVAAGNILKLPADPGAHTLFGFDNTTNTYKPFLIGTGLSFDQASSTLSSTATGAETGAYDADTWNGNTNAPTKDAVRDKIESLAGGHDAVTLAASATPILGLSTQEISFDTQTANYGLFGPTNGAAAAPTFRAMVAADLGTTLVPTFAGVNIVTSDGARGSMSTANTAFPACTASTVPWSGCTGNGTGNITGWANVGNAFYIVENNGTPFLVQSRITFGTNVLAAIGNTLDGTGGLASASAVGAKAPTASPSFTGTVTLPGSPGSPNYASSGTADQGTKNVNIDGAAYSYYAYGPGTGTAGVYTPVITSAPSAGARFVAVKFVGGTNGITTLTNTNVTPIGPALSTSVTAGKSVFWACIIPSSGNAECLESAGEY